MTAAILVLSQRFVRPVIVAFTGRLLLSTMGLWLVIVNALVIWAATIIAPNVATVAQPSLLWMLVFAALYTVLGGVVDAVLGLNSPRLGLASGSDKIWRALESLPTPNRNFILENLRLQQVYDLVYAEALDQTLRDTPIGQAPPLVPAQDPRRAGHLRSPGPGPSASATSSSSSARPT